MPSISLRTIREEHASLAAVLHSLRLMLDSLSMIDAHWCY